MDGFLEIGKLFFLRKFLHTYLLPFISEYIRQGDPEAEKNRPLCKICELDCIILAAYDHDKANYLNDSLLNLGVSPQNLIITCS